MCSLKCFLIEYFTPMEDATFPFRLNTILIRLKGICMQISSIARIKFAIELGIQ